MDVQRRTAAGFARGELLLEGSSGGSTDSGSGSTAGEQGGGGACQLRIDFQNENLVAAAGGRVLASVPDLICCLEADSEFWRGAASCRALQNQSIVRGRPGSQAPNTAASLPALQAASPSPQRR